MILDTSLADIDGSCLPNKLDFRRGFDTSELLAWSNPSFSLFS